MARAGKGERRRSPEVSAPRAGELEGHAALCQWDGACCRCRALCTDRPEETAREEAAESESQIRFCKVACRRRGAEFPSVPAGVWLRTEKAARLQSAPYYRRDVQPLKALMRNELTRVFVFPGLMSSLADTSRTCQS